MEIVVDLGLDGMAMLFRDYQERALRFVWEQKKGVISREVWEEVSRQLGPKPNGRAQISRASIINFLNAMVDAKVLTYTEETGKGGYHRVYSSLMGEDELWMAVRETMNEKIDAVPSAELKRECPRKY